MTQLASLTLNDGQATPVAHTFTPTRIVDGIARWEDKSTGIAVGFSRLSMQLREPLKGAKVPVYRFSLKFQLPVLEVVNASTFNGITPAPTKAYDLMADLSITVPERATTADRKNIRAYVVNALNQIDLKTAIENLEMVY